MRDPPIAKGTHTHAQHILTNTCKKSKERRNKLYGKRVLMSFSKSLPVIRLFIVVCVVCVSFVFTIAAPAALLLLACFCFYYCCCCCFCTNLSLFALSIQPFFISFVSLLRVSALLISLQPHGLFLLLQFSMAKSCSPSLPPYLLL